jgi:hypothetical protein
MKPIIFLSLLFFFVCNSLIAQIEKGTYLIGLDNKFNFKGKADYAGTGYTSFSLHLSPKFGYPIRKNLIIGAELPIIYQKSIFPREGIEREHKYSMFFVTPYIRYYVGAKKVKPYFNFKTGFGFGKSDLDGRIWKEEGAMVELGPGSTLFISENISIDFGINYLFISSKISDPFSGNYSVAKGFQGNLGMTILF